MAAVDLTGTRLANHKSLTFEVTSPGTDYRGKFPFGVSPLCLVQTYSGVAATSDVGHTL